MRRWLTRYEAKQNGGPGIWLARAHRCGLGLGLARVAGTMSWGNGHYKLFDEALAQTSLEHYGGSSSYALHLGFSIRW